jgi:hypothetical protein
MLTAARSMSRSTGRNTHPYSCCRTRSARPCRCGMVRLRPSYDTSTWCATTAAATASPTARRGRTRWSGSAATCWRSSMRSVSTRSTGAACPWEAWSASGSAQTRPIGSSGSSLPTPRAISPTSRPGTTVSRWCAKREWRNSPDPTWSAGSPRDSSSVHRRR